MNLKFNQILIRKIRRAIEINLLKIIIYIKKKMFYFLKSKKFIISVVIIFSMFFVVGYVSGTLVSYEEKWFGAGPTFWDALKPF